MAEKRENKLESVANKFTNIYNIIIFVVFLGTGIGNYVVSSYKHEQHEKQIAALDARISKTESINYELLVTQLENIQEINKDLKEKIDETNGRIDKVLEILSNK